MRTISREEVLRRLETENPWWMGAPRIGMYQDMKPRPYLKLLMPLINETTVKRAVVVMGPRRVGKTVLLHHSIQQLLRERANAKEICYISVDSPLYNGWGLQQLVELFFESQSIEPGKAKAFVFFDEIQYLKNWEIHLKKLVDTFPDMKFVASGSAAAALRLKSSESGAGRFTDFLLPPLTFYEFLELLDKSHLVEWEDIDFESIPRATDIAGLNKEFLNYVNFGGYPEVIFSPEIQANPGRFIKSDIIDKVLLRDLPSLYGISDIQELNYLFTALAYNSAQEVSLGQLSQSSGVAKNTIKRYIEYLQAAFLIKVVHRIDHNARRFQRANSFKVYLTNPSMRAALFSPVKEDDDINVIGAVAETAIFSQWFHGDTQLYYARWKHGRAEGEVDIVHIDPSAQKPRWAIEVKWTDRFFDRPYELKNLIGFCHANGLEQPLVTTKTRQGVLKQAGVELEFRPASLYCYQLGFNIISHKKFRRE